MPGGRSLAASRKCGQQVQLIGDRRPGLGDRRSCVTPQERQCPLIEFLDALVKRRVRTPLEDVQLRIRDAALQSIGEARRRELHDVRTAFVLADLLPSGPLVDLVIMNLAFLAPRCHRHAYAFAGVGAAGGTVPTFFIGIDHVAQFATD